jgi:hypothetical protein
MKCGPGNATSFWKKYKSVVTTFGQLSLYQPAQNSSVRLKEPSKGRQQSKLGNLAFKGLVGQFFRLSV